MAKEVKVSVEAKAYNKYTPVTSTSQLINDAGYVTRAELDEAIREVKDWVIQVILLGRLGDSGDNLNGNEALLAAVLDLNKTVTGGDVADRNSTLAQVAYNGGDITQVNVHED